MGRQILRWIPGLVVAATILYTLSVYPDLPARMPTHWGVNGQPTGWSPRAFGAWFVPGMMILMWGLFLILPSIDPKRANYDKFGVAYQASTLTIVAFQGIVQWAMLNVAIGRPVDLNTVIYVGLGAMFAILGTALSFAQPNWFFGIRTPWTMSDGNVWQRTHKTGGPLLAVAGIVTIVAAFTLPPMSRFLVMLVATLTAAVGSVALSYYYWRQR
jgi:uncharacterized membrane protein